MGEAVPSARYGPQIETRPREFVDLVKDNPRTPGIEAQVALYRRRQLKSDGWIVGRSVRHRDDPNHGRSVVRCFDSQNDHARPVLASLFPIRTVFAVAKVCEGNDQTGLWFRKRHKPGFHSLSKSALRWSCSGDILVAAIRSISSFVRSATARLRRANALIRCISSYSTADMKYPVARPWLVTATGSLWAISRYCPKSRANSVAGTSRMAPHSLADFTYFV